MGFLNRLSSRFGTGCAKAMIGSFNSAKKMVPDASGPEILVQTVSTRPGWSVDDAGHLIYKGKRSGHVINKKMTLAELIYIVASVELWHRLGMSGHESIVNSLIEVNRHLASKDLDDLWTLASSFENVDKFRRWAGEFWSAR
jgi:hypothetical protein